MEKYQSSICSCCGKPLSDPISIQLGIGPICRVHQKMHDKNEKTGNLFANRSDYDFWFDGDVLAIEDLGGYKSVTNDIKNVLSDIFTSSGKDLTTMKIMYKDSMGIWDGIQVSGRMQGTFHVEFYSLNERLYPNAKTKVEKI